MDVNLVTNNFFQTCVEEGEIGFGAKQLLSALMWLQERCPMARFVVITDGKKTFAFKKTKTCSNKVRVQKTKHLKLDLSTSSRCQLTPPPPHTHTPCLHSTVGYSEKFKM
jgi:hypothetical protein